MSHKPTNESRAKSLEPATFYRQAKFLLSAPRIESLGADDGLEIAFAGRSNAGKSTALNAITDQKSLARTSKTPGRTQEVVLFALDDHHRLADLPGYGYAKVSKSQKRDWELELERYFQRRESLCGLFLIMDIRHPLREGDWQMIHWCSAAGLPCHVLLSKADKLKRGAAKAATMRVVTALEDAGVAGSVQTFSGTTRDGVPAALAILDSWFGRSNDSEQQELPAHQPEAKK